MIQFASISQNFNSLGFYDTHEFIYIDYGNEKTAIKPSNGLYINFKFIWNKKLFTFILVGLFLKFYLNISAPFSDRSYLSFTKYFKDTLIVSLFTGAYFYLIKKYKPTHVMVWNPLLLSHLHMNRICKKLSIHFFGIEGE